MRQRPFWESSTIVVEGNGKKDFYIEKISERFKESARRTLRTHKKEREQFRAQLKPVPQFNQPDFSDVHHPIYLELPTRRPLLHRPAECFQNRCPSANNDFLELPVPSFSDHKFKGKTLLVRKPKKKSQSVEEKKSYQNANPEAFMSLFKRSIKENAYYVDPWGFKPDEDIPIP